MGIIDIERKKAWKINDKKKIENEWEKKRELKKEKCIKRNIND